MKESRIFHEKLDSYEESLEREWEALDQAGMLTIKKLTLQEVNFYQKAATNTLQKIKAKEESREILKKNFSKKAVLCN